MTKKWLSLLLIGLVLAQTGCGGGNGDRVLVAKYMYDDDFGPPQRHDVVVFRYPEQPLKGGVPTNYIKRLLGLAGETIAIFFGQLFVTTALNLSENPGDVDPMKLWNPEFMYSDPSPPESKMIYKEKVPIYKEKELKALAFFKEGKFEIIRKPPSVMLAQRRIVCDNDLQANDLKDVLPPRWGPARGSIWEGKDGNKTFTHTGAVKDIDWLSYQHILRPSDWPEAGDPSYEAMKATIKNREHKPQLITDFLAYNARDVDKFHTAPPPHWVGDLMLELELKVDRAGGEFWLELAKGVDRFHARFDLTSGKCQLIRLNGGQGKEDVLGEQDTAVRDAGTYQIRFANFDERLTLWVNKSMPFGDGVNYPRPWKWVPDDALADKGKWVNTGPTLNDLKPASFAAKSAAVQVSHVKLWRDTYYTTNKYPGRTDVPDGSNLSNADIWSKPDKWDPLHQLGVRTCYVQPGHYLCMGDNSPESSDSRDWGTVPERLLLGRALVVYFPFDRIGIIK